jgi:hypothetical protein
LCNAAKIGQAGFIWFAFLATFRYLSFLEIDIRFIEKQVFCMGLADLAGIKEIFKLETTVAQTNKSSCRTRPYLHHACL